MGGSADWVKDHRKELLTGAALTGLGVATGGLGFLGAGAAGATGLGAAGAEAGAAAAGAGTGLGAGAASSAIPAMAGTGAMDMTGAAGTGLLSQAAAAPPATSGIGSAMLQSLGHMGPEQANILAEQNAAFGMQTPGATLQTLSAANPTINATMGQHGLLSKLGPVFKGMGAAQQAMGAFGGPPQIQNLQKPPSMGQYPQQNASQIMARAGMMSPEQLQRLKQMGLIS